MVALKGTSSRCPVPTPLHRPSLRHLPDGPRGSADLRKAVGRLQLPVRRVEVEHRDGEDDHRILPPTILRDQQRSTGRTRAEVAGRTLLRPRKPSVGSTAAGNRPKTARRAAQDRPPQRRWRRGSSCPHSTTHPFNPTPIAPRRSRGRAMLSEGLIATSHAFSAPPQGQHGQRCGGAPSSGTAGRLTGALPPDLISCSALTSLIRDREMHCKIAWSVRFRSAREPSTCL